MEFRLNKVDVEIRQKVKDTTKSGVVHTKEGISVDTEQNKQEKKKLDWDNKDNKERKIKKYTGKKDSKIIIKAVKSVSEEDIEINAFKDCEKDKEINRGVFLDTRK